MREEDPKSQKAKCRISVCWALIPVAVAIFVSLWFDGWSPTLAILGTLGILFAALCVYAALVWSIGNSIRVAWRLAGKLREKQNSSRTIEP